MFRRYHHIEPLPERIKEVATLLFTTYPEFEGKVNESQIEKMALFAWTQWSLLNNGVCEPDRRATIMVIAHEIARSATVVGEGEIGGGVSGIATSANVGGVSIGLQPKPVSNMTEQYFGSTPYGEEFLAYLAQIGGCYYVN